MDTTTFETLPLLLTVEEMASVLHIGRNPAYQLVKGGNIQSIRIETPVFAGKSYHSGCPDCI